jgi:hypothetical protein
MAKHGVFTDKIGRTGKTSMKKQVDKISQY